MQQIITATEDLGGSEPILFPDEPLKTKLMRNGFWLYFFAVLIAPTGYIIKVFVSRSLSVEDIGLFYSVLGLMSLVATYNDLGLTEALQYFLPHYFIKKEFGKAKTILTFTLFAQIASGILIAALLYFTAPWLSENYFHSIKAIPILRTFSIYFLVINFFQVVQSLFIATQKVKWSQGIDAVRMRTIVLFTVIGRGQAFITLDTFTWFWIGGVVASLIVGIIGIAKHFKRLRIYPAKRDKTLLRKQRKYAFWVMIGANAYMLLSQLDQQFALYFFGPESAGYWTNYMSMFNIISVVSLPIIGYLFPLLNELEQKKEKEKIRLLNKMLYIGFIAIGIVAGVIAYFWGPYFAVLLFGEKFRYSGELLQQSAWFLWLVPLMGIQFQNLASRGQVKHRVGLLFISVIINCIVSLVCMRMIGLAGIIYGMAAGQLAAILGSLLILRRK